MSLNYDLYRRKIMSYYEAHGRHSLPWRHLSHEPRQRFYQVLISEMMLQQTTVSRVVPKYESWFNAFPDLEALATASLGDVLRQWQGLGYNRRARYVWEAARHVFTSGKLPETIEELVGLPGVGVNTGKAIRVYTENQAEVFMETNIRTVILNILPASQTKIADRALLKHAAELMPNENPREWYWALMDYGTYLKSQRKGLLSQVAAYRRQSPFKGSRRELRGAVIRCLSSGPRGRESLSAELNDERSSSVITELLNEGLIAQTRQNLHLPDTRPDATIIIR